MLTTIQDIPRTADGARQVARHASFMAGLPVLPCELCGRREVAQHHHLVPSLSLWRLEGGEIGRLTRFACRVPLLGPRVARWWAKRWLNRWDFVCARCFSSSVRPVISGPFSAVLSELEAESAERALWADDPDTREAWTRALSLLMNEQMALSDALQGSPLDALVAASRVHDVLLALFTAADDEARSWMRDALEDVDGLDWDVIDGELDDLEREDS